MEAFGIALALVVWWSFCFPRSIGEWYAQFKYGRDQLATEAEEE